MLIQLAHDNKAPPTVFTRSDWFLRKVITPLADASVGLVTCLYRAVASPSLGSRLEALGIGTDFVPGVLSARFLEKGLHFGLGSTLAFRRRDLEAIGGFEALLDYLADDSAPRPSPHFCPPTHCGSLSAINFAGRGPFGMPAAGDTPDCFSLSDCPGHW